MKFADIVGNREAVDRLRRMVDEDRLPHAVVIEGPEGTGKLKMARALAQYIHCENRTPDGDSCGKCAACIQHAGYSHVDVHFSFPMLKKGNKKTDETESEDWIDEWREFLDECPYADMEAWLSRLGNINGQPVIYKGEADALRRALAFTARASRYKIAIVWLPERLNDSAANKLLKLVEEPFSDTRIIMVSNRPQEILPTIYSRLQRVRVRRLSDAETADVLIGTRDAMTQTDALAVAHVAEGNVNLAMRLTGIDGGENLQRFISLMRMAYRKVIAALSKWSIEMHGIGREAQIGFLSYCSRMFRENFVANLGNPSINYMTGEEAAFSRNFSRFITPANVVQLTGEMDRAANDIAGNSSARIVFFDLAIKVVLLIKQ
ncbi:MAG: DNA polymerase III subunit delta [Muribaculaceae bacterium]|nr:DNA polymerase III subunit delta [Muribaculaceae bacterium]